MAHYRKNCISLFMTTRCNLACQYCYLKDIQLPLQSLDINFAKKGIQDFFNSTNSRHIRFFGAGEPTLEMEKIKDIYDYSFSLAGDQLITEIQTNGFFSKSTLRWISSHLDIVWISYDGPPHINDKQRVAKNGKTVSHIIQENITEIASAFSATSKLVGVRSTITPNNIYKQLEMIEYFASIGIKVIYSDPVFPPVSQENLSPVYEIPHSFYLEYAKEYLKAKNRAEELGVFYGSIFTVNFDEETQLACRSCIPSPHLTTDGFVSSCDMSYNGHILPELIYGQYDKNTNIILYDNRKIKSIRLRKADNLKDCKGCEILYNCAGGCFGEGLNETGLLLGVKQDYCDAIRFLAGELPRNQGLYPYLHS